MKKTYVYFLVPIVGLIVFSAIYWNFSTGYEAALARKAQIVREEKVQKLREEERNRKKAIDDAIAAQQRRKAEKAAKDAKDRADADYRQSLYDARNKANRDQAKVSQQVERLQRDVKAEKDAIAKLEDSRKNAVEEQKFLKIYVQQAEANTRSLTEVLDKITAADAARATAEAQAAKARNS